VVERHFAGHKRKVVAGRSKGLIVHPIPEKPIVIVLERIFALHLGQVIELLGGATLRGVAFHNGAESLEKD